MKYNHLKLFKIYKKAGGQEVVAAGLGEGLGRPVSQSAVNQYLINGLPRTAPGERSEHAKIIARLAKCTIKEVLEASKEISG